VLCKQAKLLSTTDLRRMLKFVANNRYPERDRTIILLSAKAGMRAGEIAQLTWSMVLDANGHVSDTLELRNRIAKKGSGRRVPMHPELKKAVKAMYRETVQKYGSATGPVIRSERSTGVPDTTASDTIKGMKPNSIVNWFSRLFNGLGLEGCSSHSGRRTFVTMAARLVAKSGGSIRDVQQLAGHRSIEMTQRYIEGDTAAQRKLVNML